MDQHSRADHSPAPFFVYARHATIAIVCAVVILLALNFGDKFGLISHFTKAVLRATVGCTLISFMTYLALRAPLTSALRRTLLFLLICVVYILVSDILQHVRWLDDVPVVGANSDSRWFVGRVVAAGVVCGVFLSLYQLLRSIDESHRKYQIHLDELSQASRISTMNEVTAGIAHELNQPLSAIATYAHSAKSHLQGDSGGAPQRATELLGKIEAQACRAGDIIKHLRQLVAHGELTPETVDFNDVVREAIEICTARATELRQRIEFRLAPGLPRVRADVVQIQQLVVNLVVNALEANALRNDSENVVSVVTSQPDDEHVSIAVVDDGPGLPAERPSQVFEPFYSTKDHGMGIGLTICQSIAEAHHGQLTASSNNGHAKPSGATFSLQLMVRGPGLPADSEQPTEQDASESFVSGQTT